MFFKDVLIKVISHECMTEQQKRDFIFKLIHHLANKNGDNDNKPLVVKSLEVCLSVALENGSSSSTAIAIYAFSVWGVRYPSYLKEYLSIEVISSTLSEKNHVKLTIILMWLKEGLLILLKDNHYMDSISPMLSEILENKLQECGRYSSFISQLSELYLLCPTLLPPPHLRLNFAKTVMRCVASFQTPPKPEMLSQMKNIGDLVNLLWESLKLEDILSTLIAMYNIISNTDTTIEVCPAMAHLLSLVNPQVVEGLGPRIVSDPQNCNESFVATLNRLCRWLLGWPTAYLTLVHWIKTLVRLLYQYGRNIVPSQITLEQVPILLETLRIPVCRSGVLSTITVLLMSFQYSPIAFHKIIPEMIRIIEYIENESSDSSSDTVMALAKLCHIQMALYPGHPEAYQALMDALYKYPSPSEEEMKSVIKAHQWMNASSLNSSKGLSRLLDESALSVYQKRSPEQRVGLRNLGNTCYMNSVIQALFMTDDFRHSILHTIPKSNQRLLLKLQHLFTSLCFSNRNFVSPLAFHDDSRPPWFSPGMQQDCSEYLRHMMTTLHEEERSGQELPEYQERVIIESETASIASDVQPILDDNFQNEVNVDEQVVGQDCKCVDEKIYYCRNEDEKDVLILKTFSEELAVGEMTNSEETSMADLEKMDLESRSDNHSGSLKRKHNVSLMSATSQSVKSPKGDNSSVTTEIDSSSDSGISGDLAEDSDFPSSPYALSVPKGSLPPSDKCFTLEEVVGETDYFVSQVYKTFGGKIATCIKCLKCKTESIHKDVFTDVNLTFQDSDQCNAATTLRKQPERVCKQKLGENSCDLKIENMVSDYLMPERLTGENQYQCEKCGGKFDAERSIQIIETPSHLILTQLRFYYDTSRGQRQKVFTNVDFGEELLFPNRHNLAPYMETALPETSRVAADAGKNESPITFIPDGYDLYALYGVVVHSGFSSEGGHYYCYARNSSLAGLPLDIRERFGSLVDWYNFNDENVTKTNFSSISRLTRTFTRDTAYILFYRKVDPRETAPTSVPFLEDLSSLRLDLQENLEKDNLKYKSEQEAEFFRKRFSQRSADDILKSFRKDNNDDRPPPSGSCGGGSEFSITSREVF